MSFPFFQAIPTDVFKTRVRDESRGGAILSRWQTSDSSEIILAGQKVVVFIAARLPFTPTCSSQPPCPPPLRKSFMRSSRSAASIKNLCVSVKRMHFVSSSGSERGGKKKKKAKNWSSCSPIRRLHPREMRVE